MNWRRFLRRETIHSEQREELEFYVDATTDEYVARGMDPAEARIAARRKLGNVTLIQDEIYRMNTLTFIDGVWRDVRYALRMIRTKPGFSIPVLLSLMLGIAANVTIFSIINAVLIRPLPYADSEKLVGVFNSAIFSGQVINDWPLSIDLFSAYEENTTSFQEFGIWTSEIAALSGVGEPEQVATVTMTNGVLRALQVHPYLGRSFSRADERDGAQKTAILSYGYWQRKFGGDAHILGR